MKKIIFVLLASNLCLARAFAQEVSFQIQAGLSTAIKEILTIEKDKVLCVATADGNLLLWDVTRNKLSNRIPLDAEIYDIEFLPSSQVLAIATPAKIFLHKYGSGKLEPMSEYRCDNPTALWAAGSDLWIAAEKEILQLDVSGTYPEMLSRTSTGRGAAYTLRVFDDKVLLASNGGVSVYRISGESIMNGPDTSTVETSEMDTSSIGNDEPEVKGLIERNEFNTGWYAHYWNEGKRQLIVSRESRLLVFEYANQQVTSRSVDIPSLSKGNITGIIRLGDKLMIGTNEGLIFQLSYPLKPGEIPKRFEMKSGSVTHLTELTGLLVTGDFYGNVVVSDPASLDEIMSMNDESIPALTGVYLDSRNQMITAHKDPKGAQVRIWDLSRASLVKAIGLPAQQIINVRINGDTIETHHADLSIYRITGGAGGYDTSNVQRPITPYVPGFEIDLPDSDPMLVIEGNRMHLREAARMPGTYQWLDSVSGWKVTYAIPPLVQCESLPPYYVVEAFYRDAGLLEYMETWDVLDKDMFYMKACRYTEDQFLKYAATTNIPREKSLSFFRRIKNPAVPTLRVVDEKTNDTLFNLRQNGLQFLQYHAEKRSWAMFYDSAAYLFSLADRKLERLSISLPMGMFHYDFNDSCLAVTSVNKTMVYARNKTSSTSWLSFGNQDFLVYNQDGYYRTRGRSDRLVGYENGLEKPFSYFDLKYNRPDILLRQLTGGNEEERRVFARAFEKRKQKMNGKLPVWSNSYRENLFAFSTPLYNKEGYVVIPSKVNPQIRINSFVNGVLVAADSQPGSRIELSPGLNKLELQYSNLRGDTIYQVKEQYVYSPIQREQRWYFFGGGIDRYSDSSLNLQYAVKDIRDLSSALREHKKNVVVDTRENERLEAGGWSDWKQKLSSTSVNDVLVVSLSGHGYLDSLGNFYLASHRSTADHFLPAISYDQILDLVDAAPARKRIIFLDACHSGLLDDEASTKALPEGVRVKSFIRKKQASTGTVPFRVMQEEFLDLARHKGTMVIAAAAGSEFAMESSARKNGLFTFALMQGIFEHKADRNNDRRITTSELREYLGREVEILSGGGQKPTINQDNQGPEWNIIEY